MILTFQINGFTDWLEAILKSNWPFRRFQMIVENDFTSEIEARVILSIG